MRWIFDQEFLDPYGNDMFLSGASTRYGYMYYVPSSLRNPVTNRQQPMDNIFFSSLILTRKKIMLPGIESEYRIKTSEKFAKFVLLWNRFIECWIDRIISASFFFNSQLLVGLLDTGKDGLTSCKTFGSFVWMVF